MKKRVFSLAFMIALLCVVLAVGTAGILAASETDIAYPVEGGNIYFDKATGTITDCDTTVTAATIPAEIDGVAVIAIGDSAFEKCKTLTDVEIPDSVTAIGISAFDDCDALASVTFPDSVTAIGKFAFYSCDGLTGVTIPDSVTTIGPYAFYSCEALASVEIGDSVTTISTYAFYNCGALASVTFPDSVTTIDDCAFYECDSLTSVTIPDSVTKIGSHAFSHCGLTSVEIPDSVTTLGGGAFASCNLTSVEIPSNIKTIGSELFRDCTKLENVKICDGITSIGRWAFCNCDSLRSIEIPESVTDISDDAFASSGLTSIKIPNSITAIRDGVFRNCNNLTSVEIPESVTTIGAYAFGYCDSLTSIEIPDSVTSIGNFAFTYSALTSIDIPDSVTTIGTYAFAYCDSLTSIEIPDSVTSIGNLAFAYSALTSIDIPDSVTSIGYMLFKGCNGLTSFEISESITTIGDYAFANTALTSIEIPGNVETIGHRAFEGCSNLTSVKLCDGITSIDAEAFYNCDGLTSIEIADSVTTIGDYAFYDCDGLTTFEIPTNITAIGDYAFANTALTSITLHGNIETIGEKVFDGCSNLTSVKLCEGITSIGAKAFYNCDALPSIEIADSVTSIGDYAFYDCDGLTSFEIPDGVTSIGSSAFGNCDSLTSVTIGAGLASIGTDAFSSCEALTGFVVSEANQNFSSDEHGVLFDKQKTQLLMYPHACPGKYVIADGTEIIGSYAFACCDGMTSMTIPGSVKEIMEGAFTSCSNLKTLTIAEGVEHIHVGAFAGCGLTSITLPHSIKSIAGSAFTISSTSDVKVYYNGTKEEWRLLALSNDDFDEITVYCTDGAYGPVICEYGGMYFNKETGTIFDSDSNVGSVIYIPAEIEGVAVTTIGAYAFNEDREEFATHDITQVWLEHGITTIETGAFEHCRALEKVYIPTSVKYIGPRAFNVDVLSTEYWDQVYELQYLFDKFSVTYAGNEAQWAEIDIDDNNAYLAIAEGMEKIDYENTNPDDGTEGDDVTNDLNFTMDITVGSEMRVTYSIPASNVDAYEEFYLVVSKDAADGTPITTTYGLTADREAMTAVLHPTTNEVLTYQATYTGIDAKEMGDSFEATLCVVDSNGKIFSSATIRTSIKDFLLEKLNDPVSDAEMKTLAVDMLKYGAAAQVRFDYDTDRLVTASLTADQLALGTQSVPAAVDRCSISGEGANVSANISANSKVELTLSCIAAGQADPTAVKCVITDKDGKVLAELATENKLDVMYRAMYDNVGAKQMREVISATFYNAEGTAISKTVNWSIESYVAQVRANAESTEAEIAVADAMLAYGDSVAAYMAANGQ